MRNRKLVTVQNNVLSNYNLVLVIDTMECSIGFVEAWDSRGGNAVLSNHGLDLG